MLENKLVRTYTLTNEIMKAEAGRISNRWNALDVNSIDWGLSKGCGGEAEQVLKWMKGVGKLDWFKLECVGGMAGLTEGGIQTLKPSYIWQNIKALSHVSAHIATAIMPLRDNKGEPLAEPNLAAVRQQRGWIIDTWNLNLPSSKSDYSMKDYLFKYGRDVVFG
jgi:hypothetical protein